MSRELTEEEVLDNDIDPIDGIAAIRREQGNEEAADDLVRENSEVTEKVIAEVEEEVVEEKEKEDAEEVIVQELEDTDPEEEAKKTSEEVTTEVAKKRFKASGQEFEFTDAEIMDQFEGVFGKAMDYTKKMQTMAPYRKMISALEEERVTQEQFDLALDVLKGDKAAIKKLALDRDIDLRDLSFDDDMEPYESKGYGKSDSQLEIQEIENSISKDPEYATTVDVIDVQWDNDSREAILANPKMIAGLHSDIKSGVYAKVAPEAAKLQMSDGNSKSNLDYYLLAGAEYQKSIEAVTQQKAVDDLNKGAQEAETKFGKGSSEAESKRAASPTGSIAGKKGVVDYMDDDNDEQYNAWYKKVTSGN